MISFDPTSPYRKAAIVLAIVLALLGCYVFGRHDGYSKAEALGKAQVAELKAAQEAANRLASDTARRIVDAEVIRRDKLAEELAAARTTISEQGKRITNRRIEDASRSVVAVAGRCSFGPGWVGLYNESWGFGDGDPAGPATAPGSGGEAGAIPTAQAGEFRQGGVTPEDIQVVNRDNAWICRDTTAKYLALIKWAQGLPQTTNAPTLSMEAR